MLILPLATVAKPVWCDRAVLNRDKGSEATAGVRCNFGQIGLRSCSLLAPDVWAAERREGRSEESQFRFSFPL
jgi:hypothetical protein